MVVVRSHPAATYSAARTSPQLRAARGYGVTSLQLDLVGLQRRRRHACRRGACRTGLGTSIVQALAKQLRATVVVAQAHPETRVTMALRDAW